ncbi:UNVERIFIED_CONTAM: hypothetical protein HDU68_012118 [Siphonaria sp. JEL0065]|nr:hypothetical protein HDU68_012118 [Siphonaria sp. JEL0065]
MQEAQTESLLDQFARMHNVQAAPYLTQDLCTPAVPNGFDWSTDFQVIVNGGEALIGLMIWVQDYPPYLSGAPRRAGSFSSSGINNLVTHSAACGHTLVHSKPLNCGVIASSNSSLLAWKAPTCGVFGQMIEVRGLCITEKGLGRFSLQVPTGGRAAAETMNSACACGRLLPAAPIPLNSESITAVTTVKLDPGKKSTKTVKGKQSKKNSSPKSTGTPKGIKKEGVKARPSTAPSVKAQNGAAGAIAISTTATTPPGSNSGVVPGSDNATNQESQAVSAVVKPPGSNSGNVPGEVVTPTDAIRVATNNEPKAVDSSSIMNDKNSQASTTIPLPPGSNGGTVPAESSPLTGPIVFKAPGSNAGVVLGPNGQQVSDQIVSQQSFRLSQASSNFRCPYAFAVVLALLL